MGWQDRDYANVTGPAGIGFNRSVGRGGRIRSVATMLIWINVAIFVLGSISQELRLLFFAHGAMVPEAVLHGHVWRLVTSDYLHWDTGHIFMNMLGLYFLGRPLEQVWGPRKFFAIYSIAGIVGSLCYMILSLGWLPSGFAAGASGCVLGLLGAAAVLFPHAKVYVYFLFPVKIRVLAMILCAVYVLNIWNSGHNAGGDACHIGGLVFGVWWAMKGDRWWSSRRRPVVATRARGGFSELVEQRRSDAETIDRILSKVHTSGIASLTDREKRSLADATERQRQSEQRYNQSDRA